MDLDKSESKIMLDNICRNVSVIAKKEDSSTRGILKVKNSDDATDNFISILTKSAASGANANLAKGPKDDLLLWVFHKFHQKLYEKKIIYRTDYCVWAGANPDIMKGRKQLSNGPNAALRIERAFTQRGRSSELCKGPSGLAKGSMYKTVPNSTTVACN